MGGVFRLRGVSNRGGAEQASQSLRIVLLGVLMTAAACGNSEDPTTSEIPNGEVVPGSIDGLWILENSDLNLDIDTETAQVDGRTSCSRLLGSLTFLDSGAITSFSLPGREDRGCDQDETDQVDDLQKLLQSVASAEAEQGGYQLLDADGDTLGRLRVGS